MTQKAALFVWMIVRKGESVLLVQGHGPDDPERLMDRSPWRYMCEPVIAFLQSDGRPGRFNHLHNLGDGKTAIAQCV